MSGTKEPVLVAWDSCVWLAWFNAESDKPLESIRATLAESEAGKLTLLMSAVCFAEVLDIADSPDAGTKIRAYAKRKNVFRADLDFRIAEKAAEIRKRSIDANARGERIRKIRTPDALIAAIALIYRATVLHSFDDALLKASKTPIVDGLEIRHPRSLSDAEGYGRLFRDDDFHVVRVTTESSQALSPRTSGSETEGADAAASEAPESTEEL